MSDVTQILAKIEAGDRQAANELLPMVYDELRRLAAVKMAGERVDHTLQATGLVHEAYLRLVGSPNGQEWDNRGHFFSAAAEAMRRILVEAARRKKRIKHGGQLERVELNDEGLAIDLPVDDLLQIDEALAQLEESDQQAAGLLKLRYFAGLSIEEAADLLGIPARTAYRSWTYARAWMYRRVGGGDRPVAGES